MYTSTLSECVHCLRYCATRLLEVPGNIFIILVSIVGSAVLIMVGVKITVF
jgi:hypothetical protein